MAGSHRVLSNGVPADQDPLTPLAQTLKFELPMYGNELGRLPVFGQFNFTESHKRPRREAEPSCVDFSVPGYINTCSASSHNDPVCAPNASSTQLSHPAGACPGVPLQDWDLYSLYPGFGANPGNTAPAPSQGEPDQYKVDGGVMDSDTLAMWSTAPSSFE